MRILHLLAAIAATLLFAAAPAIHASGTNALHPANAIAANAPEKTPLPGELAAVTTPAEPSAAQPEAGKAAIGTPRAAITFADAVQRYEAGDNAAAAEAFRTLAEAMPSAAVFYNLGNAYYRSREYGRAIASYEKAQAMDYANPAIAANLARARKAANIAAAQPSRWQQYAQRLSPNTWTALAVISFWAALALWLVPPLFRKRSGIWRPSLLALCTTVLLLSLAGVYPWLQLSRRGTVLEADTPLLLAPTQTSPVHSYVQAGQSATLLRRHGSFSQVRFADGAKGWIADARFSTAWQQ